MDKKKIKYLSEHPIIAEVVSGTILLIVGLFIGASNNPVIEHYFAADTASTFIDAYLVETGYVDESILEIESLDQQFRMIHDSFAEQDNAIQKALVNMGEDQEEISEMERAVLLSKLPNSAKILYEECSDKDELIKQKNKSIEQLNKDNTDLQKQVDDYKQRKEAELVDTGLIIDGELMNNGDSVKTAIAKVDGHNYYSESLLNTYIVEEKISYDSQGKTVIVGSAKPEKVKFSWDMVTNAEGVDVYQIGAGNSFVMDTKSFSEGIVLSGTDSFYVYLGGKYSKLSFLHGHIDNTLIADLKLTIYALDEKNEAYTVLATVPLRGEMACDSVEIPLAYATKIKITVSGGRNYDESYYTKFGLTDIYFYS